MAIKVGKTVPSLSSSLAYYWRVVFRQRRRDYGAINVPSA